MIVDSLAIQLQNSLITPPSAQPQQFTLTFKRGALSSDYMIIDASLIAKNAILQHVSMSFTTT